MKVYWKLAIAGTVVATAVIAAGSHWEKSEQLANLLLTQATSDRASSGQEDVDDNDEDDEGDSGHPTGVKAPTLIKLSASHPSTVRLTRQDSAERLGITVDEVQPAPPPESLRLPGTLLIDPNRLVHIHTRFAGEAVSIGQCDEASGPSRPLQYGDRVKKGQVIAVIWSKEIGEKKSELVDALSRVELSQQILKRLESLQAGVVAERQIVEARRTVEADLIAVNKAERTLRSWRISDDEIEAIRDEVKSIRDRQSKTDWETDRKWAEVEVRSAIDGVIVEKNFNVGDMVDPQDDLFKVADLSQLQVVVNVYEENLRALRSLKPESRKWKISVKSEDDETKPIAGSFSLIGSMIDPAQRTGVVMGWLDNSKCEYSVGQFITATIELPAEKDVVVVPESALIEEGDSSSVFVEVDSLQREYSRRGVNVVRRAAGLVYVRSAPSEESQLAVGDRVVTSGVLALGGELVNLVAAQHD